MVYAVGIAGVKCLMCLARGVHTVISRLPVVFVKYMLYLKRVHDVCDVFYVYMTRNVSVHVQGGAFTAAA